MVDATARIWDTETGKEVVVFKGSETALDHAVFDREQQRVVDHIADGTARIWDTATAREIARLQGTYEMVERRRILAEWQARGYGIRRRTVRTWHIDGGETVRVLAGHTDAVHGVAFSPDGQRVVTASFDKGARIWDARDGREITRLGEDGVVLSASFDPQGKRVVTAGQEGMVHIWNAESGKRTMTLKGHTERVESAAFDPAGQRVVTSGFDKTARIWNAESGEVLATLRHDDWVRSAAFAPDGQRLVTATDGRVAFVVDPATLKVLATLQGHTSAVSEAQFDHTGKRVLTASFDSTARIWNAENGKELAVFRRTRPAVAFSAQSSTRRTGVLWRDSPMARCASGTRKAAKRSLP